MRTRPGRRTAALAAAALVAAAAAAPGALAGWRPTRGIGIGPPMAPAPQAALSEGGIATGVWVGSSCPDPLATTQPPRDIASTATALAGDAWPPARLIAPELPAPAPGHDVAALADGSAATAIWIVDDPGGPLLVSSDLRPDGGWSEPVAISRGAAVSDPQLVVTRNGIAVAAWRQDGAVVTSRRGAPGGAWDQPLIISTPGRPVGPPQVGADTRGDTTIVWEDPQQRAILVSSRLAARNAWTMPRPISRPGRAATAPSLAVGPNGSALFAWLAAAGGDRWSVSAATGTVRGVARRSATVSGRAYVSPAGPAAAVNGYGEGIVAWNQASGNTLVVSAAQRSATGEWERPRRVSLLSERAAGRPEAVLDDLGAAIVVWRIDAVRGGGGIVGIKGSRRPAGGSWSSHPHLLDPNQQTNLASGPSLAGNGRGDALAIWQTGGFPCARVAAGGYEAPLRPTLASLAPVRSRVISGRDIRVRVRMGRAGPLALTVRRVGVADAAIAVQRRVRAGSSVLTLGAVWPIGRYVVTARTGAAFGGSATATIFVRPRPPETDRDSRRPAN